VFIVLILEQTTDITDNRIPDQRPLVHNPSKISPVQEEDRLGIIEISRRTLLSGLWRKRNKMSYAQRG
jgi:hypothetical protein